MDHLIGLKENVIIGKPIPAGTGMKRYRDIRLGTDEIEEQEEEVEEIPMLQPEEDAPIGEAEEIILNEDDTQE